jgi:CRP/FNR family transcriptional regulator, cyclic AMP receptor protein
MTDAAVHEALGRSLLAVELDAGQRARLAAAMSQRSLREGEVLVPEGIADDCLYVVASGVLGVVKGHGAADAITLSTILPGGVAGELSFLDSSKRYASLVALAETRVLGLTRGALEAFIDTEPQLLYRVMRGIVRIVHEVQRRLSVQNAELTNYLYKTHGRY